jgi:hypothetical protein
LNIEFRLLAAKNTPTQTPPPAICPHPVVLLTAGSGRYSFSGYVVQPDGSLMAVSVWAAAQAWQKWNYSTGAVG